MAASVKTISPFEVLGILNTKGIPLSWIATEFKCQQRDVRNCINILVNSGHEIAISQGEVGYEARILKSGWHRARLAAEAHYERFYGC